MKFNKQKEKMYCIYYVFVFNYLNLVNRFNSPFLSCCIRQYADRTSINRYRRVYIVNIDLWYVNVFNCLHICGSNTLQQ